MTAEYALTKDDLTAFNLYHHIHLAAIIVPRRAFAGPSEFEKFVRAARENHEKAAA
jgi:hypothetical protein